MSNDGSAKAYEMAEREVTIPNKYGIHARPAALFVKTAGQFDCEVKVEKEGMVISGKSIMGLLTIEGYQGVALKISATGVDAEAAVEALVALVAAGFHEK